MRIKPIKKVVPEDIGKDSYMFNLHCNYWKFVKKFLNGNVDNIRDDIYWESVIKAAQKFVDLYPTDYAKELILGFLAELERRNKEENS